MLIFCAPLFIELKMISMHLECTKQRRISRWTIAISHLQINHVFNLVGLINFEDVTLAYQCIIVNEPERK